MNLLKDKIKELRAEKSLTQKQLAQVVQTTADSIYSWEKGRSEPSVDFIIILAKFFEVTTDYLLGLED
ncbi:MAG: helix-turn-helix domain-containing protein [Firmicutes bacterium]|nr:helix-turn-helix domain-containing protein [Bacillota bacterium]